MAVPPMIGQPEALILYSGAQKAFSEHEKALGALGTASYLAATPGWRRCTTSRCSPPSTACFRRHPRLRTDRFGKGPGRKIPANAGGWLGAVMDWPPDMARRIDSGDYRSDVVSFLQSRTIIQRWTIPRVASSHARTVRQFGGTNERHGI
jgi:hypothetical protein